MDLVQSVVAPQLDVSPHLMGFFVPCKAVASDVFRSVLDVDVARHPSFGLGF